MTSPDPDASTHAPAVVVSPTPAGSFPGPDIAPPDETAEFRAFGAAGDAPSAGSGIVTPGHYAPPLTFDAWTPIPADAKWSTYRGPQTLLNVWIDPAWNAVKLGDGKTAYETIKDLCSDFARICGVGFVEVPFSAASLRLRYTTPDWVYWYSGSNQNYGQAGVAGVYYGTQPGTPDVWLSPLSKFDVKWTQAGGWNWRNAKPLNGYVFKRVVAYGLFLNWGHRPQQDVEKYSFRHPDLGGAFAYPDDAYPKTFKPAGQGGCGLAGADAWEAVYLRQRFGPHCWQMKRSRHLTPKRNGGTY